MDSTKATANENTQGAQHRAGEMMDSAKANAQVGFMLGILIFFEVFCCKWKVSPLSDTLQTVLGKARLLLLLVTSLGKRTDAGEF